MSACACTGDCVRMGCAPRKPMLGDPDAARFHQHIDIKRSPAPMCMHGRTLPGLCPHCAGINDTRVRKLPKGVVP